MVYVKLIRKTNAGLGYLKSVCNYILNEDKEWGIVSNGVSNDYPDEIYNEMLFTKKYFGKEELNPLIHIIISYDKYVMLNDAQKYGKKCAKYYKDKYQYVLTTHLEKRKIGKDKYYTCHTHILINPVNYRNGKMFNSSIEEMTKFCMYVKKITEARFYKFDYGRGDD